MTIKELNLTGETEFWTFPLHKTIEALDLLNNLYWLDINNSNLKENHAFYEIFLNVVDYRLCCDDYEEIKDDNIQKNHLYFCIVRLRSNIAQYRLIVQQKDVESDMQKFSNVAISNINNHINTRYKTFEKSVDGKVDQAVKNIEPQLMSTILTVMGVFTAIISIVMSVIVTSSSWLNNANGASAIIAFIVPSLVAVTSMSVLLFIVFSRKKENIIVILGRDWDAPNIVTKSVKRSKIYAWISVVALILCLIGVLFISAKEAKNSVEPHVRYIIKEEMYKIVTDESEESDKFEIKIEFDFDGENLSIPYDEKYIHDGVLHYCSEHNQLE